MNEGVPIFCSGRSHFSSEDHQIVIVDLTLGQMLAEFAKLLLRPHLGGAARCAGGKDAIVGLLQKPWSWRHLSDRFEQIVEALRVLVTQDRIALAPFSMDSVEPGPKAPSCCTECPIGYGIAQLTLEGIGAPDALVPWCI